jgi:predicted acetyltransferase
VTVSFLVEETIILEKTTDKLYHIMLYNKWMQDLEKQEKEFLEQATHVNAWDRFLVENGEKVVLQV